MPHVRFDLLDVKSPSYRRKGRYKAGDVRFPYETNDFDFVCALNVFTYLSKVGIANYLRETYRVLRPGGLALLTIKAIVDGDLEPRAGSTYRCRVNGEWAPRKGWSAAYDDVHVRTMIDDAGLETYAFEIGTWHKSTSRSGERPLKGRPGADLYVVTPNRR
jgi:SAM-dependent methyltransferase